VRVASRALLGLVVLVAVAGPALAVQDWYEYYLQARDDVARRRWSDCLQNLDRALQLRPRSGLRLRTYGVDFIDYFPHYYRGVCLLQQPSLPSDVAQVARLKTVLDEFSREESAGEITKDAAQHGALRKQRDEAQRQQLALMTKLARAQVEHLLQQAHELARRGAWDDALAELAKARPLASGLDAETARIVAAENDRVRGLQREALDLAARRQRLEQRIADGQRLLDQGRPSDAKLAFDAAREIDPADARAAEGSRVAQERILATTTREKRREAYAAGKALFDVQRYEEAQGPLTDACAGGENPDACALLAQARKIVEEVRKQKELQAEIDRDMAKGEALMRKGRWPDAYVAFESALRLDPGHARAREQASAAERRTGAAMLEAWLPNEEPELALFKPEAKVEGGIPVVESPTLSLQGVATDDRGIDRLEFKVGDAVVGGPLIPPRLSEAPERSYPFVRELPLQPGRNRIAVTVYDTGGLSRTVPIEIERRLPFYESGYFLPSALAGAASLVGVGWGAHRVRRRRAMRQRFNPYIAGAPVLDDAMFYGRGKLTRRMLSTLSRNSLMITGERRIGKTTFLHHLKRALAEDQAGEWRFFPVFVDLQGVPEQAFFHALMADIVEGLRLVGRTREALRFRPDAERYEARDFSHDLPLVLEELRTRTEKRVKLALLIDEVDVLNEYSESVNQRLRGIFMKSFSENLVAVMSGVAIRRRWKSEVSPWYNFFDEIELPPFTREEAEALVREPVAGVFRFQPEAVDRILDLSALRPYFVQKYCVHAVGHMLDEGRSTIRVADVEAARAAVEIEGPPGAPQAHAPATGAVAH